MSFFIYTLLQSPENILFYKCTKIIELAQLYNPQSSIQKKFGLRVSLALALVKFHIFKVNKKNIHPLNLILENFVDKRNVDSNKLYVKGSNSMIPVILKL